MTRLLLLAARRPALIKRGTSGTGISDAETTLIRETARQCSDSFKRFRRQP
jgi:hypothetical protein